MILLIFSAEYRVFKAWEGLDRFQCPRNSLPFSGIMLTSLLHTAPLRKTILSSEMVSIICASETKYSKLYHLLLYYPSYKRFVVVKIMLKSSHMHYNHRHITQSSHVTPDSAFLK